MTGASGFGATAGGTVTGPLGPGQTFGSRYHVIRLLGAGGMGAVYQAWDDALGVAVAIKVIRPEIAADPAAAEELERKFKRELLLARQVTHKNVVRIHDLGDIDGIKYITMPYVQGSSLAAILKRQGTLSVSRALLLGRQIVSGLGAAHDAGVVHRDLKPENIMVDGDLALIMDFGIARTTTGTDGTRSGVVMGTIGYMAPEQAQGADVDNRADLYAFGLVLYDMLAGRTRFAAGQTAVGELFQRMSSAPRPLRELNPDVPPAVEAIVMRCVQPDRAHRYQRAKDLLADLDRLDDHGHPVQGATLATPVATIAAPPVTPAALPTPAGRRFPKAAAIMLGAAAVLAVAVVGVVAVRNGWFTPAAEQAQTAAGPTSLIVLPFRNATGDPALDWLGRTIPEILRSEIGQSASLRTIGSDRVTQLLTDLRISADATLDPATLRSLGEFSNAQVVISGSFVRLGTAIRLDTDLRDLRNDQSSVPLTVQAPNQAGLVPAIGELARAIHAGLSLPENVENELRATASRPSSQSLVALRYYNEGLALSRQGKSTEALKSFEMATQEDSEFALAFSKLAESYKNLRRDNEAESLSRRASDLSAGLPARERLLIQAAHARILGNNTEAIAAYEKLLEASPEDADVRFELARLYEETSDYDKARDHLRRVLEADPRYIDALLAAGRVDIRRGQPQDALQHLNNAHGLAVQFQNDEARGNILNALGTAYRLLNRRDEALRHYQDALDLQTRLGDKGGMAASLGQLAQLQLSVGKRPEALAYHKQALEIRREIGDKDGTATTLAALGNLHFTQSEYDDALGYYQQALPLLRDLGDRRAEGVLLNNIGSVYFNEARYQDARTYFEQALAVREPLKVARDTAQTVRNLAEINVKLGQYDDALDRYLKALDLDRSGGEKRGVALGSYAVGTLFEYQGRFNAAFKSKEEALTTWRGLGDESIWLAEMVSGYGRALTLLGRFDEARKPLDEALARATALKNQPIIAQTLNFQGDNAFLAGDLANARRLFAEALKVAAESRDRHLILLTRVNVAKVDATENAAAAAATLTKLSQDADQEGLRYLSADASIYLGEALIRLKRYEQARQALERALSRSDLLKLQVLAARSHHALATLFDAQRNAAEAERHRTQARRLIGEVEKESGVEAVTRRADLNPIRAATAAR